ncbi:hypothetical protein [Paracidovorax avenae]|uniref:hypothetical protein n=1 Tax=Paracidovorax avenae TaxID=80867 RepID=UPI001AD84E5D|nr:hypothetical protein [Paracidovorax avenae]
MAQATPQAPIAKDPPTLTREQVELLIYANLHKKLEDELREGVQRELERAVRDASLTIDQRTESANKSIAEKGASTTLQVLGEVRLWLLGSATLFIVGAGALGFFSWQGWQHLEQETFNRTRQRVESWLALGSDSPIKTSLEQLRTRTILDAYQVRAIRRMEQNGSDTTIPPLGSEEMQRLYALLLDTSTSDGDFFDAAKLVALARGHFILNPLDGQIKDIAEKVFTVEKYSNEKRFYLLSAWAAEPAMIPMSKGLLEKKSTPVEWRIIAFRNIARTDRRQASEWAKKELLDCSDALLAHEYALQVALQQSNESDLVRWTESSVSKASPRHAIHLVSVAVVPLDYKGRGVPLSQTSIALFKRGIDAGASLGLSTRGRAGMDVLIEKRDGATTHLHQLPALSAFFEEKALLTAVLADFTDLSTFAAKIKQLQIGDASSRIAEIQADLSKGGSIRGEAGNLLDDKSVDGLVLLVANQDGQEIKLTAKWKTKTGVYGGDTVLAVNTHGTSFQYSYDRDAIGRIELSRGREYFLN